MKMAVAQCERICFARRKINLSTVFAARNVAINQLTERTPLASFIQYDVRLR